MMRRYAVLAAVAAFLVVADAEARGRGRRKKGERVTFLWRDSKDAAVAAASEAEPSKPVMCFLRRADGTVDRQYTEILFGPTDIARASRRDFAAFRIDTRTEEGKELVKRHKIRRDGALLWYDSNGNFILLIDKALKASYITATVKTWGAALTKLERDVAKRVREASGHLDRKRYTSALKSLEPVIDIKGPLAESVDNVLTPIKKRGRMLLRKVGKLSHGRTGKASLLRAIAGEFRGCSVEAKAREMADAGADVGSDAAARSSVTGTPEMPDPTIDMMLREVGKNAPDGDAPAVADDPRPLDELLAAARKCLGEATGLRKADDNVGAFMTLGEGLDLATKALIKKSGNVANRRFVESIAAQYYECFKSLVE